MDGDGNIAEDEVYTESWMDGAGRVRTKPDGTVYNFERDEIDPLGNKFNSACFPPRPNRGLGTQWFSSGSIIDWELFGASNYGQGCFYDGVPELCQNVNQAMGEGGESVGEITFFDFPVFSDQSGRWAQGAVEQMVHDLRYEGESDSTLLDVHFGEANSDDVSTVTVKAGSPIYQVKKKYDGSDPKSPFHFFESDRKLKDQECDEKLSRIFGGNAKAMESAGDINGTNRYVNNGFYTPGHSATPANDKPVWGEQEMGGPKIKDLQRGGIIHNYTDVTGSPRTDIPLTAPGGWVAGYSDYQGGNPITGLRYSNGITIEFVHVGTTNKNNIPTVPSAGKTGTLREIGYVGGKGSTAPTSKTYHHTHIVFYSNKATYTTIDPRKLFCGW